MPIKTLDGANMDIDLVSGEKTSWKQSCTTKDRQ